jgi:hypothetical protein
MSARSIFFGKNEVDYLQVKDTAVPHPWILQLNNSTQESPSEANSPFLMKKFQAFYSTRRFIALFTRVCHLQICSARSIQSTLPNQCRLDKIYFNITLPSTSRSSTPSHPFRYPYQNPVRISLIKHRCHIPRPPYSP